MVGAYDYVKGICLHLLATSMEIPEQRHGQQENFPWKMSCCYNPQVQCLLENASRRRGGFYEDNRRLNYVE